MSWCDIFLSWLWFWYLNSGFSHCKKIIWILFKYGNMRPVIALALKSHRPDVGWINKMDRGITECYDSGKETVFNTNQSHYDPYSSILKMERCTPNGMEWEIEWILNQLFYVVLFWWNCITSTKHGSMDTFVSYLFYFISCTVDSRAATIG